MAPDKTFTVGLGTKGATISGQSILWPRRRRQDHKAGNFVLNIDLLENRTIDSVVRDIDGFIIETIVTGDISSWAPATEGLTTTLNSTTTDVHIDTRTASLAVVADDTEIIMTPTRPNGSRQEIYGVTFPILFLANGVVFETDEVGARQHIRQIITNSIFVFSFDVDLTGSILRDVLVYTGDQGVVSWNQTATAGDTLLIERSIFNSPVAEFGVIRARNKLEAKNITINNCIFNGGGNTTSDNFGMIQTEGAFAHVVNVNHCLFWGCGQIHRSDNTMHTVNYKNCAYFSVHDYEVGSAATRNYTTCVGSDPTVGSRPAGVTLTDEISAFLAYHKTPGGSGNLFVRDARPISNSASSLFEAGTPVAGVTEDMDGRPRSLTKPSIGPTEGFPSFTVSPEGILIVPAA